MMFAEVWIWFCGIENLFHITAHSSKIFVHFGQQQRPFNPDNPKVLCL